LHRVVHNALEALGLAILASACSEAAAPRRILTLSPPSIMLLICQEGTLTATVTPPGAGAVQYRSDNAAVATVSQAGVARGVRDGVARIHGWLAADTTVRDSVLVSVTSPGPCPVRAG
jgi:hypothetical protein